MNSEAEKADSKFTKKGYADTSVHPVSAINPGVKCLRGIPSRPNGTGVWCKFTQSLRLPHSTSQSWRRADGQPLCTPHHDAMGK